MLKLLTISAVVLHLAYGGCGVQSSSRIVGGSETDQHTWPWQASLRKNRWSGSRHICGATIISDRWLITASHCVEGGNTSSLQVVVGDHHKGTVQASETTHTLSRIIMHDLYDANTLQTEGLPYDIALLEVSTPMEFNNEVQPACMPETENLDVVGNPDCWITGWGLTKGEQDENVLQEVKVDPLTTSECQNKWGSSMIRDSQICVGDGTIGGCNGDSGGPISCKVNGKYTVIGAASWVYSGCQRRGYPTVYTRVSSYLSWIKNHTR